MSKCNYCAFFSAACRDPNWDKYTTDIITEINHWADMLGPIDIPTIFFGGGTPSLMPTNAFAKIINHIAMRFHIPPAAEVTIESNPATINDMRLADFVAAGLNRLSVGVQSLDDARLQFLGRRHNAADARTLLAAAQKLGLRTSADFMYGMPGDTADTVIKMCHEINQLGLGHVSMYELTIEPDTPFGKMNLDMPSDHEMADMYSAIDTTLSLPRYEVSNYATAGNECRHNQNVWDGAPYIGIGPGAAGRILLNNVWYEQWGNGAHFAPIDAATRAIEKIITGMRTVRGAQMTHDVAQQINMDYVHKNPDLVVIADGRIRATQKGLLILDEMLVNLTR